MNLISLKSLSRILLFAILTVSFNFSYAQLIRTDNLKLDHPLGYSKELKKPVPKLFLSQVPETLFVYAIRVQFVQDNNPNTTGDGRFDMSNNYADSVDSPPHDSLYFINHLEFLKNYYWKASKGKLFIKYQMLGTVRNLNKVMSDYSPGRNENLARLGTLFYEAWNSADSVVDFTGIDPTRSSFIIFHAGAGRDIDLRSQGIFQGEQDLPSIYLGLSSLKSIYGDTAKGYYTKEGIIILGSSILPEQEYRIINSSFGDVFLELGINGIIVGSIGSSLGLPDLFDTRTGVTAIGRFGLMDGQSIFSFSGVFPPEPSAWEKQYLGWVRPIEVISNGTFQTKSASLDDGNSSVYKVFISGKEYFLIENRNRDAKKNGQTVYFVKNGITQSLTFDSDVEGFNYAEVWQLKGCITDVDELDWSLPGDKEDTLNYQGGILIWHIDENVIDANFASNTINIDINHRGVDLEEAKGAQQIGVTINTPFGAITGDGTPYDYWYNGYHQVPSSVYRNAFDQSSYPNSNSYNNILSRVCIKNFSAADSVMSFTYENCSPIVNINGYPRFVGKDTTGNTQPIGFDYNGNGLDEIFVNVKDSLYGFRDNGSPIRVDMPNGFLKDSVANQVVGFINVNFANYVAGVYGNSYNLLSFSIDTATGNPNVTKITSNTTISTPILQLFNYIILYAGSPSGKILNLNPVTQVITYDSVSNRKINLLTERYTGVNSAYQFIDESYRSGSNGWFPLGTQFDVNSDSVHVTNDNKLLLDGVEISRNLRISQINSVPICCDINQDGKQEIVFTADDKVFAVNRYGVVIDNFPFKVSGVTSITSGCAVADLNSDGVYEVIFGTGDGRVYAYSVNGKVLDGFPVLTGSKIRSTPAIVNTGSNFGIVVYSTDGYLYGWKTPWTYDASRVLWRNYLKDSRHSNSNTGKSSLSTTNPCLPQDRVYNWPNPAYGSTTNIRYYLGSQVNSVKIKIMDLSGELVTTLNGTVNSGFDNEVVWDVSKVQSGIYIAVLELDGGCNETASIKIAVVK